MCQKLAEVRNALEKLQIWNKKRKKSAYLHAYVERLLYSQISSGVHQTQSNFPHKCFVLKVKVSSFGTFETTTEILSSVSPCQSALMLCQRNRFGERGPLSFCYQHSCHSRSVSFILDPIKKFRSRAQID